MDKKKPIEVEFERSHLWVRASIADAPDGSGVIVTLWDAYDGTRREFISFLGGSWELRSDYEIGRQLIGTADIRAPRAHSARRAWAKRIWDHV